MKVSKNLVLVSLVAVLVASTLFAGVTAARYGRITKGQTTTYNLGNAGVTYASAYKDGTVQIMRRDDSGFHAPVGYAHMEKLVELRFFDPDWNREKYPAGAVFVFYQVTQKELRLFNAGLLKIYFFDTWRGGWTACPTFALQGGTRLACRFHAYGVFSLMAKTKL
jgi:hypothetical protein